MEKKKKAKKKKRTTSSPKPTTKPHKERTQEPMPKAASSQNYRKGW